MRTERDLKMNQNGVEQGKYRDAKTALKTNQIVGQNEPDSKQTKIDSQEKRKWQNEGITRTRSKRTGGKKWK